MTDRALPPGCLDLVPKPYVLAPETPALLPVTSGQELYRWYHLNLCGQALLDPRGQRVHFLETDFVHLIKLTDREGKEPRNRQLTIDQIQSGRYQLKPGRFDLRRTQELTWARLIVERPTIIVPNWQVMGSANPGDACIRNFGVAGGRPIFRVLICGHAGRKRRAVTIFPRERFAELEIRTVLWP